jgi:hypothetical protein
LLPFRILRAFEDDRCVESHHREDGKAMIRYFMASHLASLTEDEPAVCVFGLSARQLGYG